MGCNCGKKKKVPVLATGASTPVLQDAKTYDVVGSDGAVVASTTNLVFARVEARRAGGTVVPRSTTSVPQT